MKCSMVLGVLSLIFVLLNFDNVQVDASVLCSGATDDGCDDYCDFVYSRYVDGCCDAESTCYCCNNESGSYTCANQAAPESSVSSPSPDPYCYCIVAQEIPYCFKQSNSTSMFVKKQ